MEKNNVGFVLEGGGGGMRVVMFGFHSKIQLKGI